LIPTTGACAYKAGVAYTAIVGKSGLGQTYDHVRRDDTQSAICATPTSLDT
jgi:hypothetical protein